MKKDEKLVYSLTDHCCLACGGRILQLESGGFATGGGNPIFRCSECGKKTSGLGPDNICWCGFHYRGNDFTYPYMCVPLSAAKDSERIRNALLMCGCDPDNPKVEVGIVLRNSI